jgi:hypothetical protein
MTYRANPDPLGYDLRDIDQAILAMVRDALSGRTHDEVASELSAAVRQRLTSRSVIDEPSVGHGKASRLLIMDNGPITVLSIIDGALDWFFKPGGEVWITDMVLFGMREPAPPAGKVHRAAKVNFDKWFNRTDSPIKVVETNEGRAHARNMQLWEMAGRPDGMQPSSTNLGETSTISKLRTVRNLITKQEAVFVLMDDRDGRAAIKALPMYVDLIGTQSFINLVAEEYGAKEAQTFWAALQVILRNEFASVDPMTRISDGES